MKRLLSIGILATIVPFRAMAAISYTLIQPIGPLTVITDIGQYLQGIVKIAIGVAGVLAVVMIVVCGVKLILESESASAKSEAKKCIWEAILGLLLAIGAWVFLYTLNPALVTSAVPSVTVAGSPQDTSTAGPFSAGGGQFGGAGANGMWGAPGNDPTPTQPGWYFQYQDASGNTKYSQQFITQDACAQVQTRQSGTTQTSTTGNQPCAQVFSTAQPLAADEASVRQSLCGNNSCVNQKPIGINRAACTRVGDPASCTNVAGLPGNAVSAIQGIQSACGCNILISGGTEYWKHKTHAAGRAIFDLSQNGNGAAALANTIKSGQGPYSSFSGNQRWLYNGFWYTDEKSAQRHWHVCADGENYSFCKTPPGPAGGGTPGVGGGTVPNVNL